MAKYTLFDTHAHYDHPLFMGNGADILKALFSDKTIDGVVIPSITYESNYNRAMFPEDDFPGVYFAAGIHPKYALSRAFPDRNELADFDRLFEDKRTAAVKTGLDYSRKKIGEFNKLHQQRFFAWLIDTSVRYELPLVLHIRDALDAACNVLLEHPPKTEAVAHCFCSDYESARALMSVGVTRFGIGGMLSRSDLHKLRECVAQLPMSALLLETDAPFVKPEGFKGAVNTSATLIQTAELIAQIKGMPLDETVDALQKNAYDFYGIKKSV